jgi:ParB family transcriptional regulator, chromosome partitioning protein
MVRRGLGRGLATLLGERTPVSTASVSMETPETPESGDASVRLIPVQSITPNPYQPRLELDPEALEELAQSIRQHGLLEPVLVRSLDSNENTFQLIAGERRLRAAQLAGMEQVPALVHEASDAEMLEIAIVENVQRENLNPIEEARAYRRLLEGVGEGGAGLTQQEVAERVGKSRAAVANLLRLLDLPEYVQESVQKGTLSQGHAKILAGLAPEKCHEAWTYVVENKASVRDLEHFLASPVAPTPEPASEPSVPRAKTKSQSSQNALDTHWNSIQEALQERLRTKVLLRKNKDDSGIIEVHFFNSEDLDRLLESLDIEL